MQVKELKQDGLSYELEIQLESSEIDTHVDRKLQEYAKTMKIPGFRPGKVPLAVMKQRYGKAVLGEVLETAVNDSSQKALLQKGLKPALQPKIEVKEFDEGKDLVYTMAVEVLPKIEVMDLKSVKLEKLVAQPADEAIEEALTKIAEQNRETKTVETKRASKKGDVVLIDFAGRTKADDKAHPGMQSNDHELELGGGQFIPGFEDQLIGKKAGEKVEVTVSFPEEYHASELAGQDAIFDVDVKEIKEYTEATIDDEFAKTLGMDDLSALKDAISTQIANEYDQVSKMKLKRQLLDILDEEHDVEMPQGMVDMEFENIKRQLMIESPDKVENGELVLSEEDEEEMKAIAERRVKLGIILSDIGTANKITVTDQELQRTVIQEAQKYPGQEAQVFEYYKNNRQALEALRAPAFEEKVVNFILELVKVDEKDVSVDELMAEDDDERYGSNKKEAKKAPAKKTPAKKTAEKKDDAAKDKKPAAKKKAPAKTSATKKAPVKKKAAAKS